MRVLIVEDDSRLAHALKASLRDAGFAVDLAFTGEEAEALGCSEPYDAVVLDLGLPELDGVSVLSGWRKNGRAMPVLILTARDAWADKVEGFRAGADDYLTKPFRTEEVILRLRALIRRGAGRPETVLSCGPVSLDTVTGVVTVDGLPLKLTAFEWRILAYLMHHPERTISRTELSEHTYEDHVDRDHNSIEVIISRLRRKIGPGFIQTERGLGYKLTASPSNAFPAL